MLLLSCELVITNLLTALFCIMLYWNFVDHLKATYYVSTRYLPGQISLQGNAAYKGKQYNKAVSYYTEAIKLNESNATFYSNRAAAYLELGWYTFASCSQRISWYASSHYIQRLLLLTDNIFFPAFSKLRMTAAKLYHLIRRLVNKLMNVLLC